ncbi:Ig-like domain-containing protein, partial [Acinetobacter sp. YH12023]|uniref:Ig-like domain-containing protein n=1 Tax=Acinetobacter sp. YH12023 TaxID=2601041 RepID=UPI0015D178F0
MLQVQIVSKEHHTILENLQTSNVVLKEASVVVIHTSRENVASVERVGNSLIIKTHDGQQLVIENYFSDNLDLNDVVLEENDRLYLLETANDSVGQLTVNYNPIDEIDPLLYDDSSAGLWAWLAPVVTAAGIALWAGHDSGSSSKPKDTTAPSAPTDVVISEDGTTVTGKGEPGSTVEIKDQDGNVIGTGSVDSNGDFSVELEEPLTNGETIEATVTDPAGNESEPTEATAPDTTAPEAPTDVAVSEDGTTVTGKGEPGSTVEIKDQDGNVIGTGPVDSNGDFSVELEEPLTNGETIEATVTDPAGNESEPTEATAPDTTAPVVSDVVAAPNEDGTATVTGKTEPGATVVIKDPAGNPVPVTVNPDGTFTATVPAPAPEGAYTVEATDPAGNTGTGTATLDDNVAPEAPEATVSEDGTSVIGRTEPGATVEVKDADGNVIGTGTA